MIIILPDGVNQVPCGKNIGFVRRSIVMIMSDVRWDADDVVLSLCNYKTSFS